MDPMVATLISILSLVIAIISLVVTYRHSRRSLALQEQQAQFTKLQRQNLEREEAARVTCQVAAYWYIGTNNSERICVANCGGVDAFNIQFSFRTKEGWHSPEIEEEMKTIFPLARLRPEENRNFLVAPAMGSARPWPIRITWEDVDKREYSLEQVLT